MTAVHWSTAVQKSHLRWSAANSEEVDQDIVVHEDKTAGQSTWSTGPPLKGVRDSPSRGRPSPLGHADHEPDDEPTDEELWLEHVARQVEADARPVFAALWMWLLHRALELDEDDEAS